jgi:hypothetical protein
MGPGPVHAGGTSMQRLAGMLFAASLVFCTLASAQIYKWKDAEGRIHYGSQAPPGVDAVEVSGSLEEKVSVYNTAPGAKPPATDAVADEPGAKQPASPVVIEIKLVEYELSRADERKIREEIQLIYRRYVEWLGWSPQPRHPVKVTIFGTVNAWNAVPKAMEQGREHQSHYDPRRREVLMHGDRFTDDTIGILRHEVSHAILHMELGNTPQWINEGIAEVFRSSGAVRGRLTVTPNPTWAEILKHKLREGSLEPWEKYIDIPFAEWRGESRRVEMSYYMIAWSMMGYLLSTPQGTKCLRDLTTEARKVGFRTLSKSFEKHCGSVATLDTGWRRWIERL